MKYVSLQEVTKSATALRLGIENTFTDVSHVKNVKLLCKYIYDPLCDHYKIKLPFTSWYRNFAVNRAIKGSVNSQHTTGQAVDIDVNSVKGLTNLELFNYIRKNLPFDQLIWEFDDPDGGPAWVHVSYSPMHRMEVLKAVKVGKKTKYIKYDS
jgi:zinc D-Ala-D-Ala carboxypeptidase